MKNSKLFRLAAICGFLTTIILLYAFSSFYLSMSFDDFRKKDYYNKIFNSKDQKKLDKAYKKYTEGQSLLKEYQTLMKDVDRFNKFAAETPNKETKENFLKQSTKAQKKALSKGFDAMDEFQSANEIRYDIYTKNIKTVRKTGKDNYKWAASFEQQSVSDYNNSQNILNKAKSAEGKQKFDLLKQSNDIQNLAFEKMEQAFGLYMDDPAIKMPVFDTINYETKDNTKQSNLTVEKSDQNNTKTSEIKENNQYNPLNDNNLYKSQDNFIISKLKLTPQEETAWKNAKTKNENANNEMKEVDDIYVKIDSTRNQADNTKDRVEKENLLQKAAEMEKTAFQKLISSVNQYIESNETKYNIYKNHFAEVRPKNSDKELNEGKKYETNAEQFFNSSKTQITKSNAQTNQHEKYIGLMNANNQQLMALQNQENAYLTYLKVPVVAKTDTIKPKYTAINQKGGSQKQDLYKIISVVTYTKDKPKPQPFVMKPGLSFKVQTAVTNYMLPADKFDGLMPITCENFENNPNMSFLVGDFKTAEGAEAGLKKVQNLGYRDAYLVSYVDGIKNSYTFGLKYLVKDGKYKNMVEEELATIEGRTVIAEENDHTNEKTTNLQFATGNETKTMKGLVYLVQIGTYYLPRTTQELKNISPIFIEKTNDGATKYFKGTYKDFEQADKEKNIIMSLGFDKAFVVAYNNGTQIKVEEALKMQGKYQPKEDNEQSKANVKENQIVFKIQVGAYREKWSADKEKRIQKIAKNQKLESYVDAKGLNVYTIGNFITYQEALDFKNYLAQNGLQEVFIVAFKNKIRIPVNEAIKLQEKK